MANVSQPDISKADFYMQEWLKLDEELKSYSLLTRGAFVKKYAKGLIVYISIALCLLMFVISLGSCLYISTRETASTDFLYHWSNISFCTLGFAHFPLFYGIGILIVLLCYQIEVSRYNKLCAKRDEALKNMQLYAEPEIKQYQSKSHVMEITNFLADRFSFLIRFIKRPSDCNILKTSFTFKVCHSDVGYWYDTRDVYGNEVRKFEAFSFSEHRFSPLPLTAFYTVAQALARNVDKEIHNRFPVDPSGTSYSITHDFEADHNKEIVITMSYEAKNGKYKSASDW